MTKKFSELPSKMQGLLVEFYNAMKKAIESKPRGRLLGEIAVSISEAQEKIRRSAYFKELPEELQEMINGDFNLKGNYAILSYYIKT